MTTSVDVVMGAAGRTAMESIERPALRPGEVRLRVDVAAVTRADASRLGTGPRGAECVGCVLESAAGEDGPALGARVWTRVHPRDDAPERGGAWATERVVEARALHPLPPRWTEPDGVPFGTWADVGALLVEEARLLPGEAVLITDAGTGVGLAAIQWARRLGARVVAVVRADEAVAAVEAAGADHCLVEPRESVVRAVRSWTAKQGVDVVVHSGRAGHEASWSSLVRPGGRWLVAGPCESDLSFEPSWWSEGRSVRTWRTADREACERTLTLFACGDLTPVPNRSFPLTEARAAQRWLEDIHRSGTVSLRPRGDACLDRSADAS